MHRTMITTRSFPSKLPIFSRCQRILHIMPLGRSFTTSSSTTGNVSHDRIVAHDGNNNRLFSSMVSHPTTTGTSAKQFSRTARKAPITVTERAAARIHELLSTRKDEQQQPIGIRLSVKRRGCNGYSYTLNYVHSPTEYPKDEVVQASNDVTIFIDPMALFSIVGTNMDWVDTELSSEFTFENPNSKGQCGCGESFTV